MHIEAASGAYVAPTFLKLESRSTEGSFLKCWSACQVQHSSLLSTVSLFYSFIFLC